MDHTFSCSQFTPQQLFLSGFRKFMWCLASNLDWMIQRKCLIHCAISPVLFSSTLHPDLKFRNKEHTRYNDKEVEIHYLYICSCVCCFFLPRTLTEYPYFGYQWSILAMLKESGSFYIVNWSFSLKNCFFQIIVPEHIFLIHISFIFPFKYIFSGLSAMAYINF